MFWLVGILCSAAGAAILLNIQTNVLKPDGRFKNGYKGNATPTYLLDAWPGITWKGRLGLPAVLFLIAWFCFDSSLNRHWDRVWRLAVCAVMVAAAWKVYPHCISRYRRNSTSDVGFYVGRSISSLFLGIFVTLFVIESLVPESKSQQSAQSQPEAAVPFIQINDVPSAAPPPVSTGSAPTTQGSAVQVASDDAPSKVGPNPLSAQGLPAAVVVDASPASAAESDKHVGHSSVNTHEPVAELKVTTLEGTWRCGPLQVPNGRAPSEFASRLSLTMSGDVLQGRLEASSSAESFSGRVSKDGVVQLESRGHWRDQPSRNWTTKFDGRLVEQRLSAIGTMTSTDGTLKFRDCTLEMARVF